MEDGDIEDEDGDKDYKVVPCPMINSFLHEIDESH